MATHKNPNAQLFFCKEKCKNEPIISETRE